MTSLLERKAGAGNVDPDDFNAVVDAVVTLGGSVITRKAGAAAVDPDDYNAVVDAVGTLGGAVVGRKAGASTVDSDDFNAVIDAVATLQAGGTPGYGSLVLNEVVTMATNMNLGDGFVYVPGKGLFSNAVGAPARLIKWANPETDLATYQTLTWTNSGGSQNGGYALIYASSTGKLYQSFSTYFDEADHQKVKVEAINPDNINDTANFVTIDFGFLDDLTQNNNAPQLATDNTYLYLVPKVGIQVGAYTRIYKYRLSDGALIGTADIVGKQGVHAFGYDSITNKLYFAGTSPASHTWVGWMTVDLLTQDTAEITTTSSSINDDLTFPGTGDYFWVEDEARHSPCNAYRVKKDLSTCDTVDLGTFSVTAFCDCTSWDSVNSVVLAGIADDTGGGQLVVVDPDTHTTLHTFAVPSGVNHINEIARIGATTVILATYNQTSKIARGTLS